MSTLTDDSANDDAAVSLTRELIERPSITPDDAGCQQVLASRLEAAGFACETLKFGAVTNLWARRGSASPVLCFAGHTDVVPPGDLNAWSGNPFEPIVRDGALYGRGAADMKSGLAAMVVALEQYVDANPAHTGSLALLVTSDEEGDAIDGTRRVIDALGERGEYLDWCVIGEPSSENSLADTVRIGRRGSLSGTLTIYGTQGHVAYPHNTDNPVRRFAPALQALVSRKWDDGNANFPPTSFEVVHLHASGGADNVTPAELTVRFNFRYSTEWDSTGLQQAVAELLDQHGMTYDLDWFLSGEPFLTASGALTQATIEAIEAETGSAPRLSTGGGTSDGRFIAPAGADVVEIGPVNASIHKIDEHVSVADIPRLSRIYRTIIEKLLS